MKNKFQCIYLIVISLGLNFLFIKCSNTSQKDIIEQEETPQIIAYYAGGKNAIDQYDLNGLNQLIYSFLHLKGN